MGGEASVGLAEIRDKKIAAVYSDNQKLATR